MKSLKAVITAMALALALPACTNDDEVVPTGIAGNNFFAEWDIASASLGNARISCSEADATLVVMTVFNETTGITLASTFACDAYQGLSIQQFETFSVYDVRLDLLSPFNAILSSVFIDDQFITISGTVDFGLATFFVP